MKILKRKEYTLIHIEDGDNEDLLIFVYNNGLIELPCVRMNKKQLDLLLDGLFKAKEIVNE